MRTLIGLLLSFVLTGSALAQDFGVFETMLNGSESVDQVGDQIVEKLERAGYSVLSVHPSGTDSECTGEVVVISAWDPEGVGDLFALNERTAPYALVERIAVFDDGTGTWVASINPRSLLRTVFLDEEEADEIATQRRTRLRTALDATMEREFGQNRKKGRIGKTMGVMAGGPFDEKLGTIATASDQSVSAVADMVADGFDAAEGDWGMYLSYRLDLPMQDLVIFGVGSAEMEARSFSIVGSGSDRERKDIACAGTAYAAAYPIEIVVRASEEGAVVETVDAMFRMKMFFEDAGKWAFMKNMTMPGSLAAEMKERLETALAGRQM